MQAAKKKNFEKPAAPGKVGSVRWSTVGHDWVALASPPVQPESSNPGPHMVQFHRPYRANDWPASSRLPASASFPLPAVPCEAWTLVCRCLYGVRSSTPHCKCLDFVGTQVLLIARTVCLGRVEGQEKSTQARHITIPRPFHILYFAIRHVREALHRNVMHKVWRISHHLILPHHCLIGTNCSPKLRALGT